MVFRVTYIEAAVSEILEEDGAVVGVRYKQKGSDEDKVCEICRVA